MPWLAVGAGVALASGVANYLANSSASDRANALQDKSIQDWMAVNIPDPAQRQLVLSNFVNKGVLDPVLQTAIKQDPTAFNKIITDQGNKAAQSQALSQLQEIGTSGGLRIQDKEALQEAQQAGQAQARGQRQAIQSNMAQRGLGGSGFDVAAQLQGQQGDADNSANSSLKVASDASNRALQAIQDAGNLATQYRTQDFGEQAQKASAADAINQFNTKNAQSVDAANTAAANRDNELNLNNQIDAAKYNNTLYQQQFDNNAKKIAGETGQYNAQANTATQGGQNAGNAFTNAGLGLTAAAGAIGNQQNNMDLLDKYLSNKNYLAGKTDSSGNPINPDDEEDYDSDDVDGGTTY